MARRTLQARRRPGTLEAPGPVEHGPEGGMRGGEVIAGGVPEAVVKVARSFAGRYLVGALGR